jgi:hypothetical protein
MKEVSLAQIESMIYIVRGQKIMLDSDLAQLYSVETRYLNKAVKRNSLRFPEDFMFQLSNDEFRELQKIRQLDDQHGGQRKAPSAFTENGIAMLSSILNSERAILVNIAIIRIFTRLRSFLLLEKNLNNRIDTLESGANKIFKCVFERLDAMENIIDTKLPSPKRKIGL